MKNPRTLDNPRKPKSRHRCTQCRVLDNAPMVGRVHTKCLAAMDKRLKSNKKKKRMSRHMWNGPSWGEGGMSV